MEKVQPLRSASQVRGLIEMIFVRLDEMVSDSVKTEAYGGLAEKKQSFSGPAYLDQVEKNAIYLCEGARAVNVASAHYLCAGEPVLSLGEIERFVFNTSTLQAQHTMPFHLSYVRTGACSGCEVHTDHYRYSGWRDLRQLGDWPRYIEEIEFGYVYFQAMFITAKMLLGTLLQNPQVSRVARWVPPAEVLEVVEERVEGRSNLWLGNIKLEIAVLEQKRGQEKGKPSKGVREGKPRASCSRSGRTSLWERLGLVKREETPPKAPGQTGRGAAQESRKKQPKKVPASADLALAEEHYNLGITYALQGRLEEAIREWRDALRINPNLAEAHYNLGLAYYRQGQLHEAIREYQAALRINPNYAKARYNLGEVYEQQGRLDEAVREFQAALSINPNDAEAHYNLGVAYGQQGRLDEAIREYQAALRINPNLAGAHLNLGVAYGQQGRLDEAIREYQAALRINPNHAMAHYNLGVTYRQQGWLDEAIREYQAALRINPDYAEAHCNLGLAYAQQGWLDEAIRELKLALRLGYEPAREFLALLGQL